jgi:hypothetical protein
MDSAHGGRGTNVDARMAESVEERAEAAAGVALRGLCREVEPLVE